MANREIDDTTKVHEDEFQSGKRPPSLASMVIGTLLFLTSVAAVVVLFLVGVVPPTPLITAIVIEFVATAGLVVVFLISRPKTHKVRFWMATLLSVLLMIVNLGVVKVGTDYLRFGSGIHAPSADTILYDIVVLQDGPTEVSQLAESLMGEVEDDPFGEVVHEEVLKLVKVDFVPKAMWPEMVTALMSHNVTSMVIQDGFMQILSDVDSGTYDRLRVLTSFEVDSASVPKPTPTTTPPTPTAAPPSNAYVVYVSGIDSYGSILTRSRSDVNILMVINPSTGKILLVNTPRDFYVQLRDTTGLKDKLTHAGVYGIDVSVGTLEDLYGITIDYYLRINFNSVINVVEALGGVDVESDYAFSSGGYSFVEGTNHLDGEAALAFSRARYNFAGGDRVRGQNQQRVMEAIIRKLSNPSILLGYDRILAAVQYSIQTSMPQEMMSAQVREQLSSGRGWDVKSISVTGDDASEYTYSYPWQRLYVMIPDQESVDTAIAEINAAMEG